MLEYEFVSKVRKDIEVFLTRSIDEDCTRRVLVFPPLDNRHRFLIHRTVGEVNPDINLATRSLGEDDRRRTVVYFGQVASSQPLINGTTTMMEVVENAPNRIQKYETTSSPKHKRPISKLAASPSMSARDTPPARAKNRRPDMQLYVPKAKRGEPCVKPKIVETQLAPPTSVSSSLSSSPSTKIKMSAKTKRTAGEIRRTPRPTSKPSAPTPSLTSRNMTNGGATSTTSTVSDSPHVPNFATTSNYSPPAHQSPDVYYAAGSTTVAAHRCRATSQSSTECANFNSATSNQLVITSGTEWTDESHHTARSEPPKKSLHKNERTMIATRHQLPTPALTDVVGASLTRTASSNITTTAQNYANLEPILDISALDDCADATLNADINASNHTNDVVRATLTGTVSSHATTTQKYRNPEPILDISALDDCADATSNADINTSNHTNDVVRATLTRTASSHTTTAQNYTNPESIPDISALDDCVVATSNQDTNHVISASLTRTVSSHTTTAQNYTNPEPILDISTLDDCAVATSNQDMNGCSRMDDDVMVVSRQPVPTSSDCSLDSADVVARETITSDCNALSSDAFRTDVKSGATASFRKVSTSGRNSVEDALYEAATSLVEKDKAEIELEVLPTGTYWPPGDSTEDTQIMETSDDDNAERRNSQLMAEPSGGCGRNESENVVVADDAQFVDVDSLPESDAVVRLAYPEVGAEKVGRSEGWESEWSLPEIRRGDETGDDSGGGATAELETTSGSADVTEVSSMLGGGAGCCEDYEDDSWDAIYDENGDCLDPELEMQISKTFGQVSIQVPHLDYLDFKPRRLDLSDEEYGHIIEIYDFPAEFKTQDLLVAFLKFQDKGFDIKWVDDTHALGVFSSKIAAKDALAICHPYIKTRPLSQATAESRQKARRRSEFMQPYKARPQTTAAMARRLVSSALGLNLPVSKETREVERKKLLEAKERRRQASKQKDAAWDGLIGSAK